MKHLILSLCLLACVYSPVQAQAHQSTISRDQVNLIASKLLKEAPAILRNRDRSDKAMTAKSALLQALYYRLRAKLGLPQTPLSTRGFLTYEFSYREAIYTLCSEHAKEPFDYQLIVNRFLEQAMRKRT